MEKGAKSQGMWVDLEARSGKKQILPQRFQKEQGLQHLDLARSILDSWPQEL